MPFPDFFAGGTSGSTGVGGVPSGRDVPGGGESALFLYDDGGF